MVQSLGVGQHQLNTVLLVDLGGPRIVINGHDITVWIVVLMVFFIALIPIIAFLILID